MLKRICDICQKNEGNKRFKIKQLKEVLEIDEHGIWPVVKWVEVDICNECIELIRTSRKGTSNGHFRKEQNNDRT